MISWHQVPNMLPITFTTNDFKAIDLMQDDPMVISVEIANCIIKKTLVDQGSSTNILFCKTFKQMDISESQILPHVDPLFSFVGERVRTKGCIWLYTKLGHEGPLWKRLKIWYMILDTMVKSNDLITYLADLEEVFGQLKNTTWDWTPWEVCLRGRTGKIFGFHAHPPGDTCQLG